MRTVYIGATRERLQLTPAILLGEGGEAEVYRDPDPTALVKIWKLADHPSYAGNTVAQDGARKAAAARILEMQGKMPAFPPATPKHIVGPTALCYDSTTGKRIVGYRMPFVQGGTSLAEFGTRQYRESAGLSQADVVTTFLDLHRTFTEAHNAGIVIGDANPLNGIAKQREVWLIDADSMQFGGFRAWAFMGRYADPRILNWNSAAKTFTMVQPHSELTDWWSFAMMFFECLLYTHPFGGVYKPADPKDPRQKCSIEELPLRGIWVGSSKYTVKYPSAGIPFQTLPDAMLEWYRRLIEDGVREPFPQHFLTGLRFKQDAAYLAVVPSPSVVTQVVKGGVSVKRIFDVAVPGVIIQTALHNGVPVYIYHKGNQYFREHGGVILDSPLDPDLRFWFHGQSTLVGKSGVSLVHQLPERRSFSPDTFRGGHAVLASNGSSVYYTSNDRLWRQGDDNKMHEVTDVVSGQTQIFLGSTFGFGFYLAGDFRRAFLFDLQQPGKTDCAIAAIGGRLLKVTCHFGESCLWLLVTVNEGGRLINRCTLISRDGRTLGSTEEPDGADHWLGTLTGKSAATFPQQGGASIEVLVATTDDGVVLLQQDGNSFAVVKQFAGTAGLVSLTDNLLFSRNGLIVSNGREIRQVTTTT